MGEGERFQLINQSWGGRLELMEEGKEASGISTYESDAPTPSPSS